MTSMFKNKGEGAPILEGSPEKRDRVTGAKNKIESARLSTLAIVRVITVVALTVFAMQNLASTSVKFLFWSADLPLFAVALFVGVVCVVLGYLTGSRNTSRRLRKRK